MYAIHVRKAPIAARLSPDRRVFAFKKMSEKYLIRAVGSVIGNAAVWWRAGGHGYTCNLDDAGRFDEHEATWRAARDSDAVLAESKVLPLAKSYVDVRDLTEEPSLRG